MKIRFNNSQLLRIDLLFVSRNWCDGSWSISPILLDDTAASKSIEGAASFLLNGCASSSHIRDKIMPNHRLLSVTKD